MKFFVILAVCYQLKQLKKQPEKNSGLNGIRTHDLARLVWSIPAYHIEQNRTNFPSNSIKLYRTQSNERVRFRSIWFGHQTHKKVLCSISFDGRTASNSFVRLSSIEFDGMFVLFYSILHFLIQHCVFR